MKYSLLAVVIASLLHSYLAIYSLSMPCDFIQIKSVLVILSLSPKILAKYHMKMPWTSLRCVLAPITWVRPLLSMGFEQLALMHLVLHLMLVFLLTGLPCFALKNSIYICVCVCANHLLAPYMLLDSGVVLSAPRPTNDGWTAGDASMCEAPGHRVTPMGRCALLQFYLDVTRHNSQMQTKTKRFQNVCNSQEGKPFRTTVVHGVPGLHNLQVASVASAFFLYRA